MDQLGTQLDRGASAAGDHIGHLETAATAPRQANDRMKVLEARMAQGDQSVKAEYDALAAQRGAAAAPRAGEKVQNWEERNALADQLLAGTKGDGTPATESEKRWAAKQKTIPRPMPAGGNVLPTDAGPAAPPASGGVLPPDVAAAAAPPETGGVLPGEAKPGPDLVQAAPQAEAKPGGPASPQEPTGRTNPFPGTTAGAMGGLGQLQHVWGNLEPWQKMMLGVGLAGAVGGGGYALGGGGGLGAPLLSALGLAAAGYGVSGGKPGQLLEGSFWNKLFGGGQEIQGMELPTDAGPSTPAPAGMPVDPVQAKSGPGAPGAPVAPAAPATPAAAAAAAAAPAQPAAVQWNDPNLARTPQVQSMVQGLKDAGTANDMYRFRDTAAQFFANNPDVAANVKAKLAGGPVSDLKVRAVAQYLGLPPEYAATLVRQYGTIESRALQLRPVQQ